MFSAESLIHLGQLDKATLNLSVISLSVMAEKETGAKISPARIRIRTNPVVLLLVIASPGNKIFDHFFLLCQTLRRKNKNRRPKNFSLGPFQG